MAGQRILEEFVLWASLWGSRWERKSLTHDIQRLSTITLPNKLGADPYGANDGKSGAGIADQNDVVLP